MHRSTDGNDFPDSIPLYHLAVPGNSARGADREMALPEDLLDELLSAYLDGALSGDERARAEQLIDSDPVAQARFEELTSLSEVTAAARYSVPGLPDGFADSVVEAAIRRAEEESLDESHPLRLAAAAEQPTVQLGQPAVTPVKWVAGIVALAASVAIAFFAFRERSGDVPEEPENTQIAQFDPELNPEPIVEPVVPTPDETPGTLGSTEKIVSVDRPPVEDRGTPAPRVPDRVEPTPPIPDDTEMRIADSSQGQPPASTDIVSQQNRLMPFKYLLVIEVRPTDAGRSSDAINQAMTAVKIARSEERQVDEPLVAAIAEKRNPDADELAQVESVLLLEAPAKKLARLIDRLAADPEGIEAIGFTMLDNAPILRSLDSVRTIDPTEVQHEGQGWPLIGKTSATFDAWTATIGGRAFAPIPAGAAPMVMQAAGVQDNGQDELANLLIIVR